MTATKSHQITLGNPSRAGRRDHFLDGRLGVASARGVTGADRVLLDGLDQRISGKALIVRSREGLAALATATLCPEALIYNFDLDAYDAQRATKTAHTNGLERIIPQLHTDLPRTDFDWVLMPVARQGDAMLHGELLRQAHQVLRPRGKLLAATDNRKDRWLHDHIHKIFGAVTIHQQSRRGKVYVARKQNDKPLRGRHFQRMFPGRLFNQELQLESRPGVFSHGRVDVGAKALAEATKLPLGGTVVDLGCGCGVLGIAAARANPSGRSVLVDSNTRATAVTRANLTRNDVKNGVVLLGYNLNALSPASAELVLGNPPYFGDFRIFEAFAREAQRVLTEDGTYCCVTKSAESALAVCEKFFTKIEQRELRGYTVLHCANASAR